jgi:AAA ATPase domain
VAVSRGLSVFVGRERELEVLERERVAARVELRVIDVVAEPGIGKSRLLHEFRQRTGKEGAFVLAGSCSPDGQQTPFLPFIEVVRGSFRLSAGEAERDVAQLELRPTPASARPQGAGGRADRPRRHADRASHARTVAATVGGPLPALFGGAAYRGFALDRQRLRGTTGEVHRQRS